MQQSLDAFSHSPLKMHRQQMFPRAPTCPVSLEGTGWRLDKQKLQTGTSRDYRVWKLPETRAHSGHMPGPQQQTTCQVCQTSLHHPGPQQAPMSWVSWHWPGPSPQPPSTPPPFFPPGSPRFLSLPPLYTSCTPLTLPIPPIPNASSALLVPSLSGKMCIPPVSAQTFFLL